MTNAPKGGARQTVTVATGGGTDGIMDRVVPTKTHMPKPSLRSVVDPNKLERTMWIMHRVAIDLPPFPGVG